MDTAIGRAATLAAAVVILSAAVAGVQAQEGNQAPAPPLAAPDPTAAPVQLPLPPPQTAAAPEGSDSTSAPDNADEDDADTTPSNTAQAKPTPPPGPPTPTRAPSAVLRVLDKVTAETMAFEAPIGQRVRYKSLVFEVKACETRGIGDPQPQPSAYLLITSDAGVSAGDVVGPRQVFKGWIFANAPSVHALKHPVYDAWLVNCSAATPAT